MKMLIFQVSIWCLIGFCNRTMAETQVYSVSSMTDISDQRLKDVLQEISANAIDVKEYPQYQSTITNLVNMVKGLTDPSRDGNIPTRVILTDSLEINAAVLEAESGSPRTVLINLGTEPTPF